MVTTPERPTVLVVDDDQSLRTLCHAALSPVYNVVTAENGQQALRELYR
jgi:CheY-like chemotaxis protein